jgi:hypothetical protein
VEVTYLNEDLRPAFLLDSVSQAELDNVKGRHAAGVPTLLLKNVQGFSVRSSSFMSDTKLDTVSDRQF